MPKPEKKTTEQQVNDEAQKQENEQKETKKEEVGKEEQIEETGDIDARLDKLYQRFEDSARNRRPVEYVGKKEEEETTARKIKNEEDYKKWKEEDPDAAEAWLVENTTKKIIEKDKAQEKARLNAEAFTKNERAVLSRHPEAITEDGEINKNDPWIRAYQKIGKENPDLLTNPRGPLFAEAMADKLLKSGDADKFREEGAEEERKRADAAMNANTSRSTVRRPEQTKTRQLSDAEKRMAARYNMSDEQWIQYSSEVVLEKLNA